jgi:inner membrane protein
MGAEVLRVTACPYPGNPYLWHTVAETPEFYQMATIDTHKGTVETDPAQDLFYKPKATAATVAAEQSWLGRVYLDWSSWPLVTKVGPAVPPGAGPGAPDATQVRFTDLRFLYDTVLITGRTNPPLTGDVYVDPAGRVAETSFGGRAQR